MRPTARPGSGRRQPLRRRPFAVRTVEDRWFRPHLEPLERRLVLSTVVGNFLFYDGSAFDTAPGAAIAPDKSPYLPAGVDAAFANTSSYTRGINGLIIDLLGDGEHASITASDFVFKVGNNNTPGSWAPAPATSNVTIHGGAGVSGSDRVEITWGDNQIVNEWLEVQILPNDNTGLSSTEIFYWGSKVANGFGGDLLTQVPDGASVFANLGAATITNVYDYDRNGVVQVPDGAITFANLGGITTVNQALSAPALSAALANDTGPGGVPNADGISQDPTIDGVVTPASVASLLGGLDGGPVATDLTSLIQPGGGFTVSEAVLESMAGGPLADTSYVLHLRAEDTYGLVTLAEVPFTLKRSIAAPTTPDLLAASDSGASSTDDVTNDDTPTFQVTAEAGATVTLYRDGSPVGQDTANPTATVTPAVTPDGTYTFTATAEDIAGNVSAVSAGLPVTIHTAAPDVTISTAISFGDDRTPHVTVTGTSGLGLADGTQVDVDVDIDNNGSFGGAGELGRTQSTLYQGGSYFQVTPALPPTDPIDGPYLVQLRARITDIAGNEGTSPLSSMLIDTLRGTALEDYVNTDDGMYSVSTSPVSTISGSIFGNFTVYVFDLQSQQWRTTADVTDPIWQHWLQIIVPDTVSHSTALMLIDGGSNGSMPTSLNGDMIALGQIAEAREMITVVLPTVPNQALTFVGDPGSPRSEDRAIAYTFDKYVNNIGQAGNETWPLLLPMVKSAVKAMDAVQAKDTTLPGGANVDDFILSGFSKRGWTTWLTGAVDNRVVSVVPGVIDMLNMDESMVHHYGFYGFFAQHVGDYQDFNLIENILRPENQDLGRIVDPYSYLFNSNLTTIPKLLLNSTGDEFFVPDSGQFYQHDIPGPVHVRYIPNTGHGLDDTQVINSSNSWTDAILFNRTLPEYSWTVDQDGGIRVTTVTAPQVNGVKLWQATNTTRDFRNGFTGLTWTSTVLADQGGGVYVGNVGTPAGPTGATAYMVEMTYASAISGNPYIFTTEVRVKSADGYDPHAWPFFAPANAPAQGSVAPASSVVDPPTVDDNLVAVGLASTRAARGAVPLAAPSSATAPIDSGRERPERDAAVALLEEWSWVDGEADEADAADTIARALAESIGDATL